MNINDKMRLLREVTIPSLSPLGRGDGDQENVSSAAFEAIKNVAEQLWPPGSPLGEREASPGTLRKLRSKISSTLRRSSSGEVSGELRDVKKVIDSLIELGGSREFFNHVYPKDLNSFETLVRTALNACLVDKVQSLVETGKGNRGDKTLQEILVKVLLVKAEMAFREEFMFLGDDFEFETPVELLGTEDHLRYGSHEYDRAKQGPIQISYSGKEIKGGNQGEVMLTLSTINRQSQRDEYYCLFNIKTSRFQECDKHGKLIPQDNGEMSFIDLVHPMMDQRAILGAFLRLHKASARGFGKRGENYEIKESPGGKINKFILEMRMKNEQAFELKFEFSMDPKKREIDVEFGPKGGGKKTFPIGKIGDEFRELRTYLEKNFSE